MKTDTLPDHPIFGKVLYAYTRRQAIADGEQIKVDPDLLHEQGIKFPTFITRNAWNMAIECDQKALDAGQSITGRLWDVLTVFRFMAKRTKEDTINFRVKVAGRRRLVDLIAKVGPMDIDDPNPAITIMTTEDL